MDPVEAASLAADSSFDSHIDHSDSRDDELTSENINDDITAIQQSVFDAFPLTIMYVLQPAVQPQNGDVFLKSSVPMFRVTNNRGVRSNIETDRDLLPHLEFQEGERLFCEINY